jgi:hypothetical protein
MSTEIIVAVLSLLGSFCGTFSGVKLMSYRIEQLEKKVEKHNNLIERQYDIEKITAVLSEDLKVANHRIADLEGEVNK